MATIDGELPENCVAHILALTSPPDACRFAVVSNTFCCAAGSDTVWECFLPPDHHEILSQAVQLPILINGGEMSFELERSSGKKCFMISARELVIVLGDTPQYWWWIPSSDSRFSEVAELLHVCWLEIRGKIDSRVLSPKTTYCVYLVYKIAEKSYGLSYPIEASVKVGTNVSERRVYLALDEHSNGWEKLEMGEFFIDEGDEGEVDICLMEVNGGHWKRGLIVQGIEVRPKK